MKQIDEAIGRSKEEFVQRFRRKYTSEPRLPLWMVAEVMTFGQLYTFFRFLHYKEKQELSKTFDLYPPAFESWLLTLNFARNACAHHSRLWNRVLPIRPRLPNIRHHPEWHLPIEINNQRIFSVLTILKYLLNYVALNENWSERLHSLISEYDSIPIRQMGFPKKWRESPLWQ